MPRAWSVDDSHVSNPVVDPETYEMLATALRVGVNSKNIKTKQAALETVARFLEINLQPNSSGPRLNPNVQVSGDFGHLIDLQLNRFADRGNSGLL